MSFFKNLFKTKKIAQEIQLKQPIVSKNNKEIKDFIKHVQLGNLEEIKRLVDRNQKLAISFDETSYLKRTPIIWAAYYKKYDIFKFLYEKIEKFFPKHLFDEDIFNNSYISAMLTDIRTENGDLFKDQLDNINNLKENSFSKEAINVVEKTINIFKNHNFEKKES